jgi:hypothetical protein
MMIARGDGVERQGELGARRLVPTSFVAYQFADIHFASDLAAGMTSGKFALLQPVSTPLLDQIRNGIPLSPHTPKKCKTYYDKNK